MGDENMYNLYFKLNNEYDQKIYMRSMKYMTALDAYGNECVEIYDPEKFISVEKYFNQAEYVGRYLVNNEEQAITLLYDSKLLGIGYDERKDEYELLSRSTMDRYHQSFNYHLAEESKAGDKNPRVIVRSLLQEQLKKTNEKHSSFDREIDYNVKKLERVK